MNDLMTLDDIHNLIEGVVIHPLKANKDQSGVLVETLKTTWTDVCNEKLPFSQCYYSVTPSGLIRDENEWHVHPKQYDRFIAVRGDIITAVYSKGVLNLFLMGESGGDKTNYMVLIPPGALHGFAVVSKKDAVLLNFPTVLYSPQEEGRIPHEEAKAEFPDGTLFTWKKVLSEVQI